MNILITGANGFLGSHCCRVALSRGHRVVAMARPSSRTDLLRDLLEGGRVELRRGDLTDPASHAALVAGCDAVLHAAAATSEHASDLATSRAVNVAGTAALLEAARAAGSRRVVLISSQSAHEGNSSAYGRTKLESERPVKESGLGWTILRPGVIYGPDRRGVFSKLEQHLEKLPVIPVIGNGRYLQDPVHVEDVAAAAVTCLERDDLAGRTFDLAGADRLEFNAVIDTMLAIKGLRKMKLHLPVWACRLIAATTKRVMANPPLTSENIEGLLTAPPLDIAPARAAFGYAPRSFAEGFRAALAERAAAEGAQADGARSPGAAA